MKYCHNCGEEIDDGAKYCLNCGEAQLDRNDTGSDIEPEKNKTETTETDADTNGESEETLTKVEDALDYNRAIVSIIMGTVVGLVVTLAFTNVGGEGFWLLITVAGVGYFLYDNENTIKSTIGMGCYILALWMPLAPILFYFTLIPDSDPDTAAEVGKAAGSVLGMGLWGFVGLVIGLITAAVGYFIKNKL